MTWAASFRSLGARLEGMSEGPRTPANSLTWGRTLLPSVKNPALQPVPKHHDPLSGVRNPQQEGLRACQCGGEGTPHCQA